MTEEDLDDELEFEQYLAMSPEEQRRADLKLDAEIANLLRERNAWLDSLTVAQQVAFFRGRALESIRENRRRLRDPQLNQIEVISKIWRDGIIKSRMWLVKLREWRRTGIFPGSS